MARYALVIGIAEYTSPLKRLSKPATDAEAVAQRLKQHDNFQEVKLLNAEVTPKGKVQGRVTREKLEQALTIFLQEQAAKGEALIYFTGHGITVSESLGAKRGYLATSDCLIEAEGNQIIEQRRAIALDSLNTLIRNSDLSSLVVLLDCCHSGYFLKRNLVEQTLTAFMSRKDYYLIAACRGFEQACPDGKAGAGQFCANHWRIGEWQVFGSSGGIDSSVGEEWLASLGTNFTGG